MQCLIENLGGTFYNNDSNGPKLHACIEVPYFPKERISPILFGSLFSTLVGVLVGAAAGVAWLGPHRLFAKGAGTPPPEDGPPGAEPTITADADRADPDQPDRR